MMIFVIDGGGNKNEVDNQNVDEIEDDDLSR